MKFNDMFKDVGLISKSCEKFENFREIFNNLDVSLIDDFLRFTIGNYDLVFVDNANIDLYVNLYVVQSLDYLKNIKKTLSKDYNIENDYVKIIDEINNENGNETRTNNRETTDKKSIYDDEELINTNKNESLNSDNIINTNTKNNTKNEIKKNGNLTTRIKNELDLYKKNLFIDFIKSSVIKSIILNIN